MPFKNKIRLPFYLSRPQYPVEETIYRKTDGSRRVQKSIISKELEARTEWMPELIHERFTIALRHDFVHVYNDQFTGPVRINGAYEIGWIDDRDFPIAPAKFKVFDEWFNANNSTCATCDDLDQMQLIDDHFVAPLEQGGTYVIDVAANDSICCAAPVFSIVSFDPAIIANAGISQLGILTITLQPAIASAVLSEVLRYRVVCGESTMDAGVSAAITGTGPAVCALPTDLTVSFDDDDPMPVAATFTWGNPGGAVHGWFYQLFAVANGIELLVSEGVTLLPTITINALGANKDFRMKVFSRCTTSGPWGGDSSPAILNFTTPKITVGVQNATIKITVYGVPDGTGKESIWIRAEIQQPGVGFADPVNVQGLISLQGSQSNQLPFDMDIAPGSPWVEYQFPGSFQPGWGYTYQSFMGSPDSVADFTNGAIVYNLGFLLS